MKRKKPLDTGKVFTYTFKHKSSSKSHVEARDKSSKAFSCFLFYKDFYRVDAFLPTDCKYFVRYSNLHISLNVSKCRKEDDSLLLQNVQKSEKVRETINLLTDDLSSFLLLRACACSSLHSMLANGKVYKLL